MYHALARGHATAMINRCSPVSDVCDWDTAGGREKLLDAFGRVCHMKKAERARKNIHPFRGPFRQPRVNVWDKREKILYLHNLFSADEAQIFAKTDDEKPLYPERSILSMMNILVQSRDNYIQSHLICTGGISHHTMTRMLERDVVTPETLSIEVDRILILTEDINAGIEHFMPEKREALSLMLPYRDGAIPACTMAIGMGPINGYTPVPSVSARTFLSSDMVKQEDRDRMEGYVRFRQDPDGFKAWLDHTIRPWRGPEGQAEPDETDLSGPS